MPATTGGFAATTNWGLQMGDAEARKRLELLKQEHRDLDTAIAALSGQVLHDQLQMARLKKRKLRLRDEIASIEDNLVPDIIA